MTNAKADLEQPASSKVEVGREELGAKARDDKIAEVAVRVFRIRILEFAISTIPVNTMSRRKRTSRQFMEDRLKLLKRERGIPPRNPHPVYGEGSETQEEN